MNPFYPNHPREIHLPVVRWLTLLLVLIVIMTAIGGVTRLTESGLSITEWKPVTGMLPPDSEAAWTAEFEKYQASPEYRLRRTGMTLEQFKRIYFWEWLHRNWGRLIGLVYALPALAFLVLRRADRRLCAHLAVGFMLIVLQGAVGWLMVKSGLAARPFVSHYRLAAHLLIALLLFSYLLWLRNSLWTEITPVAHEPAARPLAALLWLALLLVVAQIAWGAFTAGLDAGKAYNTFPLMMDRFTPPGLLADPAGEGRRWMNLLDLPAGVQWVHRWLGTLLLFVLVLLWWKAQKIYLTERQRDALNLMLVGICLQFILGIATLVNGVPLGLAVAHQVNALLVLGSLVAALQAFHAAARRRTG